MNSYRMPKSSLAAMLVALTRSSHIHLRLEARYWPEGTAAPSLVLELNTIGEA